MGKQRRSIRCSENCFVPINGNAASSVAITFAIDLARTSGGAVTFCAALDMLMLGMGSSLAMDPSWIESLRPDAEKVGCAALDRARVEDCPATLNVAAGLAEEIVLELAPSFDLIVMGTRAIHGLAHLLDHSITDAVVRACRRPLLVVRESDAPPASCASQTVLTRLIAPNDGSEPSRVAIEIQHVRRGARRRARLCVWPGPGARGRV